MCKKPCKECPFRKNSLPGWLGSTSNPQDFLDAMEYNIIPCHLKVKWDEAEEKNLIVEGDKNPCIGALSFISNSCKLPRGARAKGTIYYNLVNKALKNDDVFHWNAEFINHHSQYNP